MKWIPYLSALVFALVAFAHLLRLIFGLEVSIQGAPAPMWVSVFGVLVPGVLCALNLWAGAKSGRETTTA